MPYAWVPAPPPTGPNPNVLPPPPRVPYAGAFSGQVFLHLFSGRRREGDFAHWVDVVGQRAGRHVMAVSFDIVYGLDMLDEAVAVMDLIDPDSASITLVDVTPVNRTRNFYNFSLETPEFFDDLFLRLTNASTPQSRLLYHLQTSNGAGYWVLTRGR